MNKKDYFYFKFTYSCNKNVLFHTKIMQAAMSYSKTLQLNARLLSDAHVQFSLRTVSNPLHSLVLVKRTITK